MQTSNFRNLYHLSSKKIAVFLVLFFMSIAAHAQYNVQHHDGKNNTRKYSYGIHLGVSQHNFRVEHSSEFLNQTAIESIEGDNDLGLEIGLIGILHPWEDIEVRAIPTISFGDRSVNYYDLSNEEYPFKVKPENTMFDIPLLVKYKSEPYKDFRMFVIGGGKYRWNLSHKEAPENTEEDYLRLKSSDVMAELGFGAEFHFPLFTLAPELKVSQGFGNQIEKDNMNAYSTTIDGLYSRVYTLSINIE